MVRSYNRHEPTAAFGLVASNTAVRPVLDADGKHCYVAALEDVLVWDIKRGECVGTWHEVGHAASVTALARSPADRDVFAVGYADGTVRLWRESAPGGSFLTFNGHKGAVTCLVWDPTGMRVASAGQDTTIVLWDAVAEQGLFRLNGHRDAVTDLQFMPDLQDVGAEPSSSRPAQLPLKAARHLLSVSKDGLLKLWDTKLQHCIETVTPGDGELWAVAAVHTADLPETEQTATALIFTGGSEGQINMWDCSLQDKSGAPQGVRVNALPAVSIQLQGALANTSTKRITQIALAPRSGHPVESRQIAALTSDRTLQTYSFRSAADIRKKMARRAKRAKEKAQQKGVAPSASGEQSLEGILPWLSHIEPGEIARPQMGRIRAFAFAAKPNAADVKTQDQPVLFVLSNNALEVQKVAAKAKGKEPGAEDAAEQAGSFILERPGHRADVRAIALSNGGELVASACSSGAVKVWNLAVGRCLRTLPCGYALCLTWLPDDSHLLVGCKDGTIHTYEVASGTEVEAIRAHEGPVWSIALKPDGSGFVSASADKTAKFWDFSNEAEADDEELQGTSAPIKTRLSLDHVRTLKMTDDILGACYSPNGKLLALALLDSTVKVFFADTLKFFLSLYGHKLPVLSLDISLDSKLIITGSADKNVKIWGLDFGDCHRSLIAHADSVMCVRFERGQQGGGLAGGRQGDSHRFWSAGKDGLLKFWDGDNFEAVQTLQGHHGEIWALDVDNRGTKIVTSGADRSIRLWEKTDEPLFLEEERERQLEAIYQNAGNSRNDDEKQIGQLAEGEAQIDGAAQPESTMVASSTDASLTVGERLIEAIEIADRDKLEQSGPLPPPRSAALLAGLQDGDEETPARFMFRVIEKIPSTQLTDVLLLLPFHNVTSLFDYIDTWLQKEWSLPLSARILFFLLRTHHQQIVNNKLLRGTINRLRTSLRAALVKNKTLVGFNASGLRYAQAQASLRKQSSLDVFEDDLVPAASIPVATKRKLVVQ